MITPRKLVLLAGASAVALSSWTPLAPVTAAQSVPAVDASLYSGMRWRSIGPLRGGRSIAVGGSEARPNEYWFGATGGGAWKTTDGGNNWEPMTDGKITSSSVGSLAVCQSNPDVVYIGGGESEFRGNIIQGDGLYKTTDGGQTWTHLPQLRASQAIARIRLHPTNCDIVYAAVFGQVYNDHPERGIFKSTDGGQTFRKTLYRDEKTAGVDISIDPTNPSVMYAGLWEAFRSPWGMSSGGPGSGLFKSTDGGETWAELTKNPGLPDGLWGKVGVSVSPVDGNRVYAIIENANGGLFVSDDAGASWRLVNDNRNLRQRAFYYTRVVADTKEKDTVYVLNVQFHRSTDGGKTTTTIRVPHGDNHDLWISATDNQRMVQSNDGGGNVTVNGGRTWTEQDFATGQFYNVFTTKHVPYHVCGAQQDNSTACVSSQANPGAGEGRLPAVFYAAGGGESGYIAPDPTDLDVFYAGSYGGFLSRLDRETGQQRSVNIYPNNPMGHSSIDIKERFQWTFPIVFSPIDPKVLYASSQHLWRTTNGGQSWERISPNLARSDPKTMQASGGPITKDQTGVETYAVIFTVAPSRQDINTIWAGSDDGWVHVTRDGGQNWEKVTPPDLPDFTRVSLIEASPHQNGVAYLAGNRYQMGDRRPYVYKTADFGKTWTKIVTGIPDTDFPRAVREDPKRRGLLYLGTEHGIYVSFDDGARWQSLRLNLPTTPVHGIVVEDRDLVIGTHGRGFYVLDNIGVLRQATPDLTTNTLFVFEPVDPLRGRDRNLSIDYYLRSDADEVKVEFLDAQGAVLRSFTGTPKAAEGTGLPPGVDPETAAFFGMAPARVGVSKGMNRFTWDMRYEGATVFPGMIMWAAQPQRGPAAPPGKYSVRVTANGETKTRDFSLGIDPRLVADGITEAYLLEQFTLSQQVRDKVTAANMAVIQIRGIRDQINQRLEKVGPRRKAELQKLADGVLNSLAAVEQEVYQVRNQSGQDPLNYPIRLNNKIAALMGIIESADHRPTQQTYEVFEELSKALDAELQKKDATLKTDLPRLNAAFQREKIEAVSTDVPVPPQTPQPRRQ
ncbi:MAG: glycosyl hydrolase [Acidobacteria bacterium]|nr:glycosyl hydrolase [Acidobacteriota bacterium]